MDVDSYQTVCFVQQKVSRKVITDHIKLIKWKNHMNILDVGCGEGSTTLTVLKPIFEGNTSSYKITGLDISKTMIKTAKETYPNEINIEFDEMDISAESIDEKYKNHFDLIVSFFCVHLIPNYTNWINNMYEMLKADGQILLLAAVRNYLVEECFKLYKEPKYLPFLREISVLSSPLISMTDGDVFIANNLEKRRFKNVTVQHFDSCVEVDDYYMRRFFTSFKELYQHLPRVLAGEFLDELSQNVTKNTPKSDNSSLNLIVDYVVYVGEK